MKSVADKICLEEEEFFTTSLSHQTISRRIKSMSIRIDGIKESIDRTLKSKGVNFKFCGLAKNEIICVTDIA